MTRFFTFFCLWLCGILLYSCEPAATSFDDIENAQYYSAKTIKIVPDTFTRLRVMTWNIRFGAGRLSWFGDACGNRVIFSENEINASLVAIANRINLLQPDILLLQEVDTKAKRSAYINELQWLLDHTYFNYAVAAYQWKAQFIPSDGLGRLEETNATLSRWSLSDAHRIQLELRKDQDGLTRYFYERCCMLNCRVNLPHNNNFYAVNIHASAFATDDTKYKHILQFENELDRISGLGGIFVAGGDLNTVPPGSDITDYCIQDICPGESYHVTASGTPHKDGSNYTPEVSWLTNLYSKYKPAVPTNLYLQNQTKYFSHTIRPTHFWDRTLDYLFTNKSWIDSTVVTHQEATVESDHAPVSVYISLSK
ncbi:MAG: endonuclease/exonuclease/phosphatase family protein [Bacteroidetes bacterium]|nr:endonuclease/exonuclease/phosphatase family protein [Bacteroidota bacterium]